MRHAWLLLLGLLFIGVGAGCGGSSTSSATLAIGSYVGTVPGTNAFVAVVAGKEDAVAYVCDGTAGLAELFRGTRSGSSVDLKAADGNRLKVTLSEDKAEGTVTLPGGSHRVAAVSAGGKAGFYRVVVKEHGQDTKLAWIVLGDGRQRGAVSASTVTQAPTLDTASRTASVSGIGTVSVPLITSKTFSKAFNFGGSSFGSTKS